MKSIQQNLIAMLKEHSARKHLTIVVGMIAIATVLSVVWSLHINGITLASDDPTCGLQEHVHTEVCYDWVAFVEDGTEGIDSTEGTEAVELVEGTEAVESTEATELTETVVTTEAIASTEAGLNGTESTGIDTENGTESLAEDTEDGTESLIEDATEDATEDVTEEATESPQPGDTKVVDDVTYIYELVCGLEEHVHTDECYETDDSEDDAYASNSAETASDSENSEDADVDGSTSENGAEKTDSEDNSDETTEDEEIVTSKTTRLTAFSTETETEEDTEEEYGISLTSTNSTFSGSYYFADQITSADAKDNLGDDYIVYTIIDGNYYVLSADGTLVQATSASSVDDVDAEGLYYIGSQSATDLVFDCWDAGSTFASYRWTLTESDTTGSYYIQNSSSGNYLSAASSESVSGTGNRYEMSGNGTMIFEITCDSISSAGVFWVELYDNNGEYITTSSARDSWFFTTEGDSVVKTAGSVYKDGIETTYDESSSSTLSAGTTYTVTVTRTTNASDSDYSDYQFIYSYYDSDSQENVVFAMYTMSSKDIADDINLHVISKDGTYTVKAYYASTVPTVTESTGYGTIASGTLDSSVSTGNYASNTGTSLTSTDEDFDITYTFTNTSDSGSDYWNAFAMEVNNGKSGTDYACLDLLADTNWWEYYYSASANDWVWNQFGVDSYTMDVQMNYYGISTTMDSASTEAANWNSDMQAGVSCVVRVVKVSDSTDQTATLTFYVTVTNADETTIMYYIATFTSSAFYDCTTNVYITGQYCTLSNVSYKMDSNYTEITTELPDDSDRTTAYARYSTSQAATTITADSSDAYAWTASVALSSETYYLYGETNTAGVNSIEWGTSATVSGTSVTGKTLTNSSNTAYLIETFYLAKVREYTVWFDATNGGNGMYSGNVVVWHTNMASTSGTRDTSGNYAATTYADSTGNCYVYVPYAYSQSVYNGLTIGSKYPYVLQGWFDIYGKSATSDGTVSRYYSFYYYDYYSDWDSIVWTARPYYYWTYTAIQITGDTVFYADWVALTYDINSDSSGNISDTTYLLADADSSTETYDNGDTKGGVDTSSFITTNVFDYNELINYWSVNIIDDSVTTSNGTTHTTSISSSSHEEVWALVSALSTNTLLGRSSWGFIFMNGTTGYPLFSVSGRGWGNGSNQSVVSQGLTTQAKDESGFLDYLFGTDNAYDVSTGDGIYGKTYVGEGDYLYQYSESTGYYYYDSSKNAATYNQTNQRFYLYDGTIIAIDSGSDSDFLPFNYELLGKSSASAINGTGSGETKNIASNSPNYWFGMSTSVSFYLPDEVGSTDANISTNGDSMIFKFVGDDDVWVYVDDVLVLDLGGIHGQCYGEIDFSEGVVRIVNAENIDYIDRDSTVIGISSTAYDSNGASVKGSSSGTTVVLEYKLSDLITDTTSYNKVIAAGSHTLTMYYLERGGSQSNAAIYFNISPVYTLKLAKVIDNGSGTLINYNKANVTFAVYTSDDFDNSTPIDTATTDDYGVLTINKLRPGVTYYLVETDAPDGFPLSYKYLTVCVDSAGNATVKVYSSSGELIETIDCNASTDKYVSSSTTISDIIASSTYSVFSLTTAASGDGVQSLYLKDTDYTSGNEYVLDNLSVFKATNNKYSSYLIVTMTYANYYEYELPSTGSTGIFPYERAGAILVLASILGLIAIAVSNLVQRRRMRMNAYKRGYNEEKAGRENRYAGTRDRPKQRNRIYGRDAPASFSDGGQERSRGTGPGTE